MPTGGATRRLVGAAHPDPAGAAARRADAGALSRCGPSPRRRRRGAAAAGRRSRRAAGRRRGAPAAGADADRHARLRQHPRGQPPGERVAARRRRSGDRRRDAALVPEPRRGALPRALARNTAGRGCWSTTRRSTPRSRAAMPPSSPPTSARRRWPSSGRRTASRCSAARRRSIRDSCARRRRPATGRTPCATLLFDVDADRRGQDARLRRRAGAPARRARATPPRRSPPTPLRAARRAAAPRRRAPSTAGMPHRRRRDAGAAVRRRLPHRPRPAQQPAQPQLAHHAAPASASASRACPRCCAAAPRDAGQRRGVSLVGHRARGAGHGVAGRSGRSWCATSAARRATRRAQTARRRGGRAARRATSPTTRRGRAPSAPCGALRDAAGRRRRVPARLRAAGRDRRSSERGFDLDIQAAADLATLVPIALAAAVIVNTGGLGSDLAAVGGGALEHLPDREVRARARRAASWPTRAGAGPSCAAASSPTPWSTPRCRPPPRTCAPPPSATPPWRAAAELRAIDCGADSREARDAETLDAAWQLAHSTIEPVRAPLSAPALSACSAS